MVVIHQDWLFNLSALLYNLRGTYLVMFLDLKVFSGHQAPCLVPGCVDTTVKGPVLPPTPQRVR